jgi:predicted dehydrogenase
VENGGGTLGAIGSHVIDTFRWFLGAEIKEVFCNLHTNVKQRPDAETGEKREVTSDDEALMILKFAEGDLLEDATANVSLSMVEAGNYRNCVEFFGTKGAIRIEDNGEIFFTDISENSWQEIKVELGEAAPKTPQNGWSRGFANFSREIINAISAGKTEIEYAATFEDGLQVQKVLDAARESDKTGCLIKI